MATTDRSKAAGVCFLGSGIAFLAVASVSLPTFSGVGAAFIALGPPSSRKRGAETDA